jgi:hypothetical protein
VVANKIICYRRLTNPFTLILINESIPTPAPQLGPGKQFKTQSPIPAWNLHKKEVNSQINARQIKIIGFAPLSNIRKNLFQV